MATQSVRIGWRTYVPAVTIDMDASATLFLNAAGITDTTLRSSINVLVKDLKRFGLWNKIKAFYPFVGGSADTHKLNLINTQQYALTFNGGWTHSSLGIKGNGTNTIANTNLSLRGVFGATSSEHTLGIYINQNPGLKYSSDIGASDGSYNYSSNGVQGSQTASMIDIFNNSGNTICYATDTSSSVWYSYSFTPPANVLGLSEFKRYNSTYAANFLSGLEVYGRRQTSTTINYNPISSVTIGGVSGSGTGYTNGYSTAYIAAALTTIESNLMYVAVQRFNTVLGRHTGTGLNPIINTYSSPAPSLVTTGLKVNLDATAITAPAESALSSSLPGNYFKNSPLWLDSSGNGNNGTFRTSGDTRFAEYFIADYLNTPEVRFRPVAITYPKLYQSGYSPDALTTTYTGSDTGTFTYGGWFKVNSNFSSTWFIRGNDAFGGGWSLGLLATLNGNVVFTAVPSGTGALTPTRAVSTVLQADVWYHAYLVWKPSAYVKVYLNGTLEAQWTNTYTALRNSPSGFGINSIVFGNTSWNDGRSIVGAYHVYDRELTEAEVRQNFNAHKSRYNVLSAEDLDAQAFVVSAGLTNATQVTAVNTLVTALKSAGLWTKMKAIYPFVGGTAQSHKFNLKDPRDVDAAYRLVFNGGWTHTSTGAKPNGTTGYADTKLKPSNIAQNSAHMSTYLRTSSSNGVDMGTSINYYFYLSAGHSAGQPPRGPLNLSTYQDTSSTLDSKAFYVTSKTNSTTNKLFRNTSLISNETVASVTPEAYNIYIGAGNRNNAGWLYSAREQAFATIGDGLTDAEALTFYNAVQAFQTSLGRNV
jgi:hypothetical protein